MRTLLVASALVLAVAPQASASSFSGNVDGLRDLLSIPSQEFVVGFHKLPPAVHAGSLYGTAEVLWTNEDLAFAVVETSEPNALKSYAHSDLRVRYVEINDQSGGLDYTANDLEYRDQYGDELVRTRLGWDNSLGAQDAAVCVVDTGVRGSHTDLSANYFAGNSWVNGEGAEEDGWNHGTAVAGVAAAVIDNSLGVTGVANSKIYNAKIMDNNADWAGDAEAADAINWCDNRNEGRLVINLSWHECDKAQAIQDAINTAWNNGRLVVASAGNDPDDCPNDDGVNFPAEMDNVIAVSCIDSDKDFCDSYISGPKVELTAPGWDVRSTCSISDTDYCYRRGTSFSSPFVAGAAALLWSDITSLENSDVRNSLGAAAEDLGDANKFGNGKVDVKCVTNPVDDNCNPSKLTSCDEGGPDAYGYTCRRRTFDWATFEGVTHDLSDEGSKTIDLGFVFEYYGVLKTGATIHSNGRLSFDDAENEIIDGYFQDLNPEFGGTIKTTTDSLGDLNIDPGIFDEDSKESGGGGSSTMDESKGNGSDGNGSQQGTSETSDTTVFAVEWRNVPHDWPVEMGLDDRLVSVQILLSETGKIAVSVDSVNDDNDLRLQEGSFANDAYIQIQKNDKCGLVGDKGTITYIEATLVYFPPDSPDTCL